MLKNTYEDSSEAAEDTDTDTSATAKGTKSRSKEMLVVAIDFGTTYSGYAFSFRSQFEKDPTIISANTVWTSGCKGLVSLKAPTVLLLKWIKAKKEFTVEEFGFDAENKYEEYVANDKETNYYLVTNFKMELYNQTASSGLNRDSLYHVAEGKTIKLSTLFSMAIRHLQKHCMKTLQARNSSVEQDDVQWVLTVPAIWTDAGKQIMIEAAVQAGIKSEKLTLVLEPEAASLYCLHLPDVKSGGQMLAEGTKYMVVDAGGGTVDINIHQVQKGRSLVELHAATGGPFGGTMVDNAFICMLKQLFGEEVFVQFSKDHMDDLLEIQREFEAKKRNFDSNRQKILFKLPASLADKYQVLTGKSISEAFNKGRLENTVTLKGDKLVLDASVMHSFFEDSCDKIVTLLEEVFNSVVERIAAIVLVGGYGESCILQSAIKSRFPHKTVIVPEDAGLAVMKGAVIYGHNPGAVLSRIARLTYGVAINQPFEEEVHPKNKKCIINGNAFCKDVFHIYIKKGQFIRMGEVNYSQTYIPIEPKQTGLPFNVYSSIETDPKFVTDPSCTWLGTLCIAVPKADAGVSRNVDVTFQFGTQIKVTAVAEATKKQTTALIDFLVVNKPL